MLLIFLQRMNFLLRWSILTNYLRHDTVLYSKTALYAVNDFQEKSLELKKACIPYAFLIFRTPISMSAARQATRAIFPFALSEPAINAKSQL